MAEKLHISRLNHTDLNMYQCGTQNCDPGHDYGPSVRDHFLIHFIIDGKGIFQVDDKIYHLEKNQGFLICPGIITYYQADFDDPWHYSWVGFHGLKAESYLKHANLTLDNPIFTYDKDDYTRNCFDEMIRTGKMLKGKEIRLLGLLYLFLSQLIETNGKKHFTDSSADRKELYVKKVLEYIEMNYSRKISISGIAQHIGLNRSYLGSIFKEYLDTSPQEYLMNFRINKACKLMESTDLSIGDISRSVGYEDPFLFSKVFRKLKDSPPSEYKKLIKHEQ